MIFGRILFTLLLIVDGTAWAGDCKQPLDKNTLNSIWLGHTTDAQLKPCDTYQFTLAILSTYAPSQPVNACATWKVEPTGKGASISDNGLLKIDPATTPDSRFVVTADIEKGRTQRTIPVVVYTDKTHPLVGFWRQTGFQCKPVGGTNMPVTGTIEELEFRASGWFSVTWTPFEVYKDYWGTYKIDPASNSFSLKIERGNYVPQVFHGDGTYKLTNPSTLEFQDIFLGVEHKADNQQVQVPAGCVYTFKRM